MSRQDLIAPGSPTSDRFNPFPGLRPFEADEDHLFFGRERATDELLRRLRTTRFVSVLGSSGSGKSSLVRSGLIPSLYSGFMVQAGSSWRVAVFRPGEDPIGNLAQALDHPDVLGDTELAGANRMLLETTLRRSDLGLADCVQHAHLPAHENLLVVVDQFEELFRFKDSRREHGSRDEAVAFAKLLLGAASQSSVPVYVVLTMRSDFIGDCMEYPGLPEAINQGQYLIPRMTRDEMRQAIAGPVAVGGGEIAPRLVARLLNEVGDDPDQLPVIQHALMRTWDRWEANDPEDGPLDIADYEAVGTMASALSRHAEEAFDELGDDASREVAERLFKALTDRSADGRGVRRPTAVSEVAAIAGVDTATVSRVVDVFRKPGRSFLMPPSRVALTPDSILDISHESLMRNWERLTEWVEEESHAGKSFKRLSRAAQRYERGEGSLWVDPELALGMQWLERQKPTEVWADRYEPHLDSALRFLEESTRTQDAERRKVEEERVSKLRRARVISAIMTTAAAVTLVFGLLALRAGQKARTAENLAEKEAQTSVAVTDFLVGLFEVADPEAGQGADITAREILDAGTARIETELADEPAVRARMQSTVGTVYRSLGLYDQAEPLLRSGLATAEELYGTDDPRTLEAKHRLAAMLWSRGRFGEAKAMQEEVLTQRRKTLGDGDPATLATLADLARTEGDLGLFKEMIAHATEAKIGQETVLGANNPATLRSRYLEAVGVMNAGRHEEGERLLAEVLEDQKSILGEDHADAAESMTSLANLYLEMGRFDEAEALYTASLEHRRELLGEEHPKTLAALDYFADLEQEKGFWDKSEAYRRQVLEAQQRVLGPEHPRTLETQMALAWLLHLQGRLEDAEALAVGAYDVSLRDSGREAPTTLRAANVLASVYAEQGRYAKAETLQLENLEIRTRLYGETQTQTITSRNNLAVLYSNWNRMDDSSRLFAENLRLCIEHFGLDHAQTLFMMNNMVSAHQRQGRYAEGDSLARESIRRHVRMFGEDNPQTLQAKLQLINNLSREKRVDESIELAREWLQGFVRTFGEVHSETFGAKMRLSWLLQNAGAAPEAILLRKEVLTGRREIFGEVHQQVAWVNEALGWGYAFMGETDSSLAYHREALSIYKQLADRDGAGPVAIHAYAQKLSGARREFQNPPEAVAYAEQACSLTDYGNRNYVATLADAYFKAGRIDDAIRMQEIALELVPEDVPDARNTLESRLAEFHEANGNLEPKKRLKAVELARLREAAEAPEASPRAMNAYVWSVLTAEFDELRDAATALPFAEKANEATGHSQAGMLDMLALTYHLLGRRDEAVRTQEKVLEQTPENDVWGRSVQELRMAVYRDEGTGAEPTRVLPGTWTGMMGPMNVAVEFVREGDQVIGYNRTELPWAPEGVAMWRYDVSTGTYQHQLADEGWTNPRWVAAGGLVLESGQIAVWRENDWRGLLLDPAPTP